MPGTLRSARDDSIGTALGIPEEPANRFRRQEAVDRRSDKEELVVQIVQLQVRANLVKR
jgi:hypothetical protein